MVTILKKILCIFPTQFMDNKRVLTIARKEYKDVEKFIYYESILKGRKEYARKTINKSRYNDLVNNTNIIKTENSFS